MKNPSQSSLIKSEISFLKSRQKVELGLLKVQFQKTTEHLKPINLLKDTLNEVSESPDLKNNLINSAIGLSTGFISKKLIIGNTSNPIKNLFGTIFEYAVANVVAKNPEKIIALSETLFHLIFKRNKDEKRTKQALENSFLIDN
jgi:hypothetical protein